MIQTSYFSPWVPLRKLIYHLIQATSFWQNYRVILREIKYFRKIAILAVVLAILGAFFEGITVGFIASFLQGLTNPTAPPIQTGINWFDIWFLGVENPPAQRFLKISCFIVILVWVRATFTYLSAFYAQQATYNLTERLHLRIYKQFLKVSLSFYAKSRSANLITSLKNEVVQVQQAFKVASNFLTHSTTMTAYLAAMIVLSWQLTLAAVVMFGLLSVGVTSINRHVREASFAVPLANREHTSIALSLIDGIRTVHASASQDFEEQKFARASRRLRDANIRVVRFSSLVYPLVQAASLTLLIGIVLLAFNLLITSGQLQAASLLTFLFALVRATPLVSGINQTRTKFNSFQGAFQNISELLREDDKPYLDDGKIEFTGLNQGIDFVGVDFGYEPNDIVLHDVTLSIKQGETTALVGGSGAGKTTLSDLIARFYEPTFGNVFIDETDIRDLRVNSLRQRMAIVSQDTFIFNTSVRENIAYGTTDYSDELIKNVAHQANALQFILDLPQGFDTQLGDRGVRLSGGQRQRIAIARALLRDPDILILDEATSALDSATERLIQESVEKLAKNRTVIIIAHRLSTIMSADKVVVLEKGRIVEQGQYNELLEQHGYLWKYHHMQYETGLAEQAKL